jgi:hypothetical protein
LNTAATTAIAGTATNDDAIAGDLGQIISSTIAAGSAVSLTSPNAANVTSISLTAGDWDVWGNVFIANSGANIQTFFVGINTTSATRASLEYVSGRSSTNVNTNSAAVVPYRRLSIASTTTVYLVADAFFASGTSTAFGGIYARRAR